MNPLASAFPLGPSTGDRRWGGLRAAIGVRLIVAALALPIGVLWWPGAGPEARWVLTTAMIAVGATSSLLWGLAKVRRGYGVQAALHVIVDLALVTGLAAATGARGSQFTMFYVLVVIAAGIQSGIAGGASAALGACCAYLALPFLARYIGLPGGFVGAQAVDPALLIALLAGVGLLAGVLGSRTQSVRDDLERTARELERVRIDRDLILRHLTSGVLTLDAEGAVAYLNPAGEQMLDLHAEDVLGLSAGQALPERLAGLREALLDGLATGRARVRGEVQIQSLAERGLPIGLSTRRLHHEGRITGVVAVFQDLSEIREMERVARRNQTLAEVGALSAAIAHELRNGLKPISGSIEVLQRELKLHGENAELMDLMGRECQRLNRFVTDLLGYSRERDLVKESIAVESHFRELLDGLRHDPRCGREVSLRMECHAAEGAVIHADREQLRQVWINLAVNAFEAVGDRGALTVRARALAPAGVMVEFEDDGPGIAPDDLARIGQPFFTTKQGGTGLGLAIATRIVERHGGTLSIDSMPGHGTRVLVTLPEASAAMAAAA